MGRPGSTEAADVRTSATEAPPIHRNRVGRAGYSAAVLRVHTSHRTEVLLDAFVRSVRGERKRWGAFAPIRVVVPNSNVATYLRLGVAERLGIAANLETTFLRRLLVELGERAVPEARAADGGLVEGHLLALLHDDDRLARAELAPVRAYLHAAGDERDAVDRRRGQLAAALAHLFDEYAGTRADLLAAWRRGGRGTDDSEREPWQRALWLDIFGPGGRLEAQAERDGLRRLPLAELWQEAMRVAPAALSGLRVHVFGLSYLGAAYHGMLGQLAERSEVHVYTLNACREEARELAAETAADAPDLHLALALWARPGRENLRLLARLPRATVDGNFPTNTGSTLLARLQTDIAHRRMPRTPGLPLLDDSLRVFACPSLRRELEVVAAEIWEILRRDPRLRASDVAVIVPEQQQALYLAQLPAVFGESCGLPHNLADAGAAGRPRVAEAIALLIGLPFSTFSRKELLPLLTHPCVMARFPSANATDWRGLPAELGIVRGAERGDFHPAYLPRDLYSWQQGLTRLALGAVADPAAGDQGAAAFALGSETYLPGPSVASDDDGALGFGLLAASLIADARFASGAGGRRERPLPQWLDYLRRMLDTYLVLDEEDPGRGLVARFLAALDDLDDGGLGDTPVCYRIAAGLAERALAALPSARGHYLADGVNVATFLPMRAIPFRAIFVLGLGQGAFPRAPGRHELDLRRGERRPGDVDGREQDLYMFLETLLSARGSITFSYVSRDEITGDELPPSAALLELRSLLERGYLGGPALARLFQDDPRQRPPLRRYQDTDARRRVLPVAEAERQAKLLGERLRATPIPRPSEGIVHGSTRPEVAPTTLAIPLPALRRFLEDPLQGSARFALGMVNDEDEAAAELSDEPFDLTPLLRSAILRQAMTAALIEERGRPSWATLLAAHERQARTAELAGNAPTGLLRQAGLDGERQILRAWHEGLPAVLGKAPRPCHRFRLVPGLDRPLDAVAGGVVQRPAPTFDLVLPATEATGALSVAVTVVGETGLWAGGDDQRAIRCSTRKSLAPDALEREDLAAFLEHVALIAGGTATTGFHSGLFHTAGERPGHRVRGFLPLAPAEARAYLRGLCAALLAGGRDRDGRAVAVHPYLLPFAAVLASRADGCSLGDAVAALAAAARKERSTAFDGPVPAAAERYRAPDEHEAERMVNERFGLFFRLAGEDA